MDRLDLYKRYATAWSAISDSERAERLADTLIEDIDYRDALNRSTGAPALARHLSGFQERFPGSSFRVLFVLNWEADALAKWQFVDAKGNPGFEGYDALTFAQDGRIASIVGFSDSEKQRLK